jgi:hypothetical protein
MAGLPTLASLVRDVPSLSPACVSHSGGATEAQAHAYCIVVVVMTFFTPTPYTHFLCNARTHASSVVQLPLVTTRTSCLRCWCVSTACQQPSKWLQTL